MKKLDAYYDGTKIVLREDVSLYKGQEFTLYVTSNPGKISKKEIDLSRFIGRGEKMFQTDAQEYVNGLRANDRV